MDEPPRHSDPIVIPFTLTIPDPRRPRPSGRRGQIGSVPPGANDPDWFRRQVEANKRIRAIQADAGRFPPYRPAPWPVPGADAPSPAEIMEEVRQARRAGFAAGDIGQGGRGSAQQVRQAHLPPHGMAALAAEHDGLGGPEPLGHD